MKNSGEIRQKVKQVRYRYLKKALDRKLRTSPDTCRFNGQHEDCGYQCCQHRMADEGWNGIVCDEKLDGRERSLLCLHFELKHSKEAIKEALDSFLKTAPIQEIAFHFPDLAALLWVLDGESGLRNTEVELDFQDSEPNPKPDMEPENEQTPALLPVDDTSILHVQDVVEPVSGWKGWFRQIFGGGS